MECWTENNWKSAKNHEDGKFNGCDKQTDDFLEAFPNFMTLTDEERHEFFQTLYAAKIKLEKSGVTVKPYFGTVHDQSWNDSDALEKKKEKSMDDGISASTGTETAVLQPNTPTQNKNYTSVSRFNSLDFRNSVIHENLEKNFKEDETCPQVSQEDFESFSEKNDISKNFNSEEEVEVFKEVHEYNSLKSVGNTFILPSLSYEVLKHRDSTTRKQVHYQENLDFLRIKGTKLKVQVTLTSRDNERMRKAKAASDDAEGSGRKPNAFCSKKDENLGSEDIKSVEDKIKDPELKDFSNVEDENKEADLPEEKENSRPDKKSFEGDKSKTKRPESGNKKPVLNKAQGVKKEVTRIIPQDQSSLERERHLESPISGNGKERILQRSETKIITGEEKTKKSVREQSDSARQRSRCNSVTGREDSSEPKETIKGTQQRILAVTTVKEGMRSNASSEKQETEVTGKKQNQIKLERQMRVEKLQKYLQKREGLYQQKLKKKNELKGATKEKSPNLKNKKEEVTSEKNAKIVSVNSFTKDKEKSETSSISEKNIVAVALSTEKMEKVQKETSKTEVRKTSDSDSSKVPNPTPIEVPPEKEKVAEVPESVKETPEQCVSLLFKSGKVVFVEDNVIEKIRNVILNLEKEAKAYNNDSENEYLILIAEYVEYLSTVMATLFEDQALNLNTPTNAKFDKESLADSKQIIRASTPTTEDEIQSEEELEIRKKHKRNKQWNTLFLKRLRKFFYCGKKKKHKKWYKRQCKVPDS